MQGTNLVIEVCSRAITLACVQCSCWELSFRTALGWGQISAAVKPFCQVQGMTKAHFQGQLCVVTEAVISANLGG